MSVVIALNERSPRWYDASFHFHRQTIDLFKEIPGCQWMPEKKIWRLPHHALKALEQNGIQYRVLSRVARNYAAPLPALMGVLRPYQQQDVQVMLNEPAFILAYDPRVGKTVVGSVAIASVLAAGRVKTAVVLYPNVVRKEWERQFPKFTQGLPFLAVDGTKPFDATPYENPFKFPYLCIGMHYELLRDDGTGKSDDGSFQMSPIVREVLNLVFKRGPSIAIADEPQLIVKRKSPRAQLFMKVGAMSEQRWCLSGTPLRSRSRDMFPIWEFLQPGSMGSYSKYTRRYSNGHEGDHGWDDKGQSNENELHARLETVWIKRTRREVAPWLPKADRRIVLCDMTKAEAAAYKQREGALGPMILGALNEDGTTKGHEAMKTLATSTSLAKMPVLLERVKHHTQDRQVKVLVFAYQHETLQRAWAKLSDAAEVKGDPLTAPLCIAGGWMIPDKRHAEIERWKAVRGPAVLLVNSLSSGIGIDLADADVAIGLEAAWVPSDFIQMESRIEDVHQGKRKSPPLLEYLLARATVDEDMVTKLIYKLAAAEAITGGTAVSAEVADDLRAAGVVDRSVLTLTREDPETISAALDSLRDRLTAGDPDLYDRGDNEEHDDEFDDENEDDENDGD